MYVPSKKWSVAAVTFVLAVILCRPEEISACGPGRGGGRRRTPRKLTPLVFKQHIPNVSENSLAASGLVEGKLTRNSPKFRDLVPNYNPDIVFRDEEGTGTDRLMTQRCKEKLDALAISVMNTWPGVRLRVTEAYDDENLHAANSLHYEGRAIDITTSDRDRSKYGLLGRLAVDAGFDYVYFESRSHIHVSVKSESADAARNGGCFTGNSMVETPTGRRKMSDLREGEEVLTVGDNGSLKFSKVLMFLDRDENQFRTFVTIETYNGEKITLTPSHLIFASLKKQSNDIREGFVTFARNVRPVDFIYKTSGNFTKNPVESVKNPLRLEKVIRVSLSIELGFYAPLTYEGNIVVNDVIASCYAVINEQTLAHLAFLPFRIVETVKEQFFSILRKLYFINDNEVTSSRSQVKGIHLYPKILYSITRYILPQTYLYHSEKHE